CTRIRTRMIMITVFDYW
nr:immunoglobulin heavy chain junction region [Macaca mulatta]